MSKLELGDILFNIITEKEFSNCRFCFQKIVGECMPIESIFSHPDLQFISHCLQAAIEYQLKDPVPGLSAVCLDCTNQLEEFVNFLKNSINFNRLLKETLCKLSEKIKYNTEISEISKLYIVVNENDLELLTSLENKDKNSDKEIVESIKSEDLGVCDETINCSDLYSSPIIDKNCRKIRFKCPHCDVTKTSEKALEIHQDKVHNMHVCKGCGKSFVGLYKLIGHEGKHYVNYECPTCQKVYHTREFFVKHIKLCADGAEKYKTRDSIEKNFACSECDKRYATYSGLKVHQRFSHGNAKPHVCEVCGKQFTAPSCLKIHMVTHTKERNFPCNMCNKKFVSKESLLYHVRRHTGEKPYSCRLCEEKFVNASARAEHVKYKHIGPTLECDICHKKFVTKSFLRQHRNRHLENRYRRSSFVNGQHVGATTELKEENSLPFPFSVALCGPEHELDINAKNVN